MTVRDGMDCYINRLQIGYNTQTEHAAFALWTQAVLSCHFGLHDALCEVHYLVQVIVL